MGQGRSFRRAIGASAITSFLQISDRVVMNFVPAYLWGAEVGGFWVFLRNWMFLLMSLEGGVGGRLSNLIAHGGHNVDGNNLYSSAFFRQLKWGFCIFLLNLIFVLLVVGYGTDLKIYDQLQYDIYVFLLIGIYAALYFQSQLICYFHKGKGEIFKGQMIVNIAKFLEVVSLVILPFLGFEIDGCVVAMILVRGGMVLILSMPRLARPPASDSSLEFDIFRDGYVLVPLLPALNSSLPVIIVAYLFNPIFVLQFSISRLFSRIVSQITQIFSRVLWPYLARLNDRAAGESSKLFLKGQAAMSVIVVVVVSVVALRLDGETLLGVNISSSLIMLLCFLSVVSSYNDLLSSMLISRGRHSSSMKLRFLLYLVLILLSLHLNVSSLNDVAIMFIVVEVLALVVQSTIWLNFMRGGSKDV